MLRSKRTLIHILGLVGLLLLIVSGAAFAQDEEGVELPVVLGDALSLPVCEDYLVAAKNELDMLGQPIVLQPEGSVERSVLVFDLSAMEPSMLVEMMRFEDIETVSAEVGDLPLMDLDDVPMSAGSDARGGLYGWIVIHFDIAGMPMCRSTGYPAVTGDDEPLALVTFQGFVAQMVSANKLSVENYQPEEPCSFETPQYCESIFMGDERADSVEGTDGADLISTGAGNDTVNANAGNDIVIGGAGGDVIHGGDGDDVIYGDGGDDILRGGDGDDIIRGGAGNDLIRGDQGNDDVSGESGVDTVRQD